MMQPRQMIASAAFFEAILRAAVGISSEPGTQTTSIWSGFTPWRFRVFSQPSSSLEVMYSLKRETMMAKRKPSARKSPSNLRPCPLRRPGIVLPAFKDLGAEYSGGPGRNKRGDLPVALGQLEGPPFGDVRVGELVADAHELLLAADEGL